MTHPYEPLREEDLKEVHEILHPLRIKWREIGLQLRLQPADLNAVLRDPNFSDDGLCLMQVLTLCLQNVNPPLTWPAVVEALRSRSVNRQDVAEEVRTGYCIYSPTPESKKESGNIDDVTVSRDDKPDEVKQQPALQTRASPGSRERREEEKGISKKDHPPPKVPKFVWLLRFGAVAMLMLSPFLLGGGVTLLVYSGMEFTGDIDCDGVGEAHSLSSFNFLFGLLCLCIPGLLFMFILYFRCEDQDTKWTEKLRITKCLVWMTIGFFIIFFILTIGELLYSLTYIAPEVYGHYNDWNEEQNANNMTLCDKEVYLTSFYILTISYAVVFLLLLVLGSFVALVYFRWVTDERRPGYLRNLITTACFKSKDRLSRPAHDATIYSL